MLSGIPADKMAKWDEVARASEAVNSHCNWACSYRGLALTAAIVPSILLVITTLIYGLSHQTGVYPDGTPYDHTASNLLAGHVLAAITGTSLIVFLALTYIAKKKRDTMVADHNDTLLTALSKDKSATTLRRTQWFEASRKYNPVSKEWMPQYLVLIPLVIMVIFAIPAIVALNANHTFISHCGDVPRVIDITVANHVVGGVFLAMAGAGLIGTIVLAHQIKCFEDRFAKDTDNTWLNRLMGVQETELSTS